MRFYREFEGRCAKSVYIRRGGTRGCVALKSDGRRLYVTLEGKPRGKTVFNCVREGMEKGAVHTGMRTLVDLSRFDGDFHWGSLLRLALLLPEGAEPFESPRTAYVVSDDLFSPSLRMLRNMFGSSTHRAFRDPAEAIDWLKADLAA